MNATRSCGYCGRQLPYHAPEGLCPSCLLKLGAAELGTSLEVRSAECGVQNEAAEAGEQRSEVGRQRPEVRSPIPEAEGSSPSSVVRGQKFGNYELLEKIGEGGMGVVYKARQINLDRLVALKLLPFGQFSRVDLVKRFRAEATAAASLHHPNIVAIYDVGEHEGQHYFSMELVGGQTLGELVRDQPLPAKRAAAYLKTIAEAVHYAHQHGILHRDLKPSNVIIDASDQPRITDFGLAKRLDDHQLSTIDHPLTLTGQVLGSPNFMAPEQAGGHAKAIGPPSDVYSLGALLYHLLTRQPPFQADTLTTLLKQVVEAEPVPPHLLNPNIPRDLETICLKCLEKEVPRRYSTARELAEELDRFLEDKPIRARPASAVGKAWKWCRRRPALAGVTAALVLTFVVGFGGALWEWRRAAHNEQFARHNAYAADMHLAQLAIGENNRRLAITLLDKYRPQGKSETRNPKPEGRPKSGTDLRGWEWRYLWQLCRGDEPSLLHRYPQAVKALAVSRDGKMLAVATGGEVALWDVATWQPLTTLSVRDPQSLAFSPTDNLLAVGTWNTNGQPVVELWEIDADVPRKKLARLAGNHSLAFSPDGKRLAILGDGGTLTIADCASGQTNQFRVQPLRYGPAGAIVFLADADHLAVGEEYGRLELRDPNTGAFTPSLDTHTGACVTALAFSPAAGLLAAGFGYGNGTIQLWDVRSRELRGQLTNHTDDVTGLAFSADGRTLASASSDWTIRLWSVTEQSQLRCLHTAREGLTALALLSDNLTLVSGGSGGSVCLWGTNSASQRLIHTNLAVCLGLESMRDVPPEGWESETLDPRTARRFGLAFTPDSGSFITLDSGGTLMRWDARSWQPVETLRALGSNHWGVALSPDGHWLATGDHPDKITLYDWTTRRVVTNFTVPFEWFGLFRFSRSGRYFIGHAARNNATHCFRIWRTGDWAEVPLTGSQFANLYPVDLSPDDRLLAAGYRNGALKLYRFPSLESVATLAQDGDMVCGVVFTPDGRELVSVDAAGRVRHWDVATGRELGEPLSGHLGIIMGAAFSPDGRRLATGGPTARDAVKLWDLEARREILTLPAEGFYFTHLVFSPDGSTLAATSLHGITHLWRAPPWEDIETAEKGKGSP